MSTSVWPYDTFISPKPPIKRQDNIGSVTCFVASPFEPKNKWDDLFLLVQSAAKQVGNDVGILIECHRADNIASSGIIHPEIWEALRTKDIIVCDVSGQNGNVMLELGIASAWRRKEHVIILRDRSDDKPHLFDINPARHLEYEISFSGMQKLFDDLRKVFLDVLASIPFEDKHPVSVNLPFMASLTNGQDAPELHTEDITHRRMLPDCLEFGSPLIYRYSWMSLGDLTLRSLRVKAEMRLTLETENLPPFMGVMVRGQSYFANFGHFVFVREGKVYLHIREDDTGKSHDEALGTVDGFDMRSFNHFDISINDEKLMVKVNKFEDTINISDLPYVFSAGRVIFIAGHCRAGIRNIEVNEL